MNKRSLDALRDLEAKKVAPARRHRPLPKGLVFGLTGFILFAVASGASWNYIYSLGLSPKQVSAKEVARQMLVVILFIVSFFEISLYLLHRFIKRQDSVIAEQDVKLKNYSTRLEELVTDQFAKLRLVEAQFQTIITNVPIIYLVLDADGRVAFAEGSGLATSGIKGRHLIGQSVFDALSDHPEVVNRLRHALNGERTAATDKIGGVWYAARYAPLKTSRGNAGALMVAMDVTEGQEATKRLEETEERFRRVVEAVTCGVAATDGDKILYANNPAAALLGKKAPSLTDRSLGEVFSAESAAAVKDAITSGQRTVYTKVNFGGNELQASIVPVEIERKGAALVIMECPNETKG